MKEAQGRMRIWQSPVLLCLIVVLVIFSFCHFRIRYVIDSFDLIYVFFPLKDLLSYQTIIVISSAETITNLN